MWRFPEVDPVAQSLETLAEDQRRKNLPLLEIETRFSFEDRIDESGITFLHRIVEDGGLYYKMSHWDHGNGLTFGDVDGDGLPDLYFISQIGKNELWHNLGGGRFENWTEHAGVDMSDRISVSGAFADLDNDGDPDLYVTTVRQGTALFENLGGGRFRDRTIGSGVDYSGHASAPVFFDFDLDGHLDLLLVMVGSYTTEERGGGGYYVGRGDAFAGHLFPDRSERSRIFRNLGDWRFRDATDELEFRDESWSGDALIIDPNRDRYPDVLLLNMQGDDHYYENQAGRGFVDKTATLFPRTSWGSMGATTLDYDGDEKIDIFITDMHSDMSEEIGPEREHLKSRMQWPESHLQGGANNVFGNSFFRRTDEGAFEEVSDRVGAETYWPWGVSVGDLNADGWDDLFVTSSMNFPWRYQVNKLLMNNQGAGFISAEFILGVEPRRNGQTYTPWFDLDCIGSETAKRHTLCQHRPGVRWRIEGTLGSRSSIVVDLDMDGDQDIVTSDFNSKPQILMSNLANDEIEPNWLSIDLRGTQSNRDGLGARIEVDLGARRLVRYVNGKAGYLSQASFPLYFGLGKSTRAREIRVLWPSGCEQILEGPHSSGTVVAATENCADLLEEEGQAP